MLFRALALLYNDITLSEFQIEKFSQDRQRLILRQAGAKTVRLSEYATGSDRDFRYQGHFFPPFFACDVTTVRAKILRLVADSTLFM